MIDPQPGDEGRGVLYKSRRVWGKRGYWEHRERGVVSSWNEHYVFVRYTGGTTAAATRREDLDWEHDALPDPRPTRPHLLAPGTKSS